MLTFMFFTRTALSICISIISIDAYANSHKNSDYQFDDNLLIGSRLGNGNLSRFNQKNLFDEGKYYSDIYVNGTFITRNSIEFRLEEKTDLLNPCFDENFYTQRLGVKKKQIQGTESFNCIALSERIEGGTFKFDVTSLRLDITIPQAEMNIRPNGYVNPQDWASGETMFFSNYDASMYRSEYKGFSSGQSNYGYLGLNSGINLGLWRIRHQSNFNHSSFGNRSSNKWNSIRTYVQRALPRIRSEITIGDNYTEGNLFASIGYRGIRISSDDRMLPDSQRQYAPKIQGTAKTNARILISQNNKKIYETNVAPGPFIVNDLYGTNYAGDLDVQVIESDGSINSFTVPFSSVPESMRPDHFRYSLALGSARGRGTDDNYFTSLTYQRGLSNQLTINTGLQIADDYFSLLGGGVLATNLGAFGFNTTFSNARVENNDRKQGWRIGMNYSKTFSSTATTLTLAGYRYSTEGYRELNDALGARTYERRGNSWDSASHKQRDHFTLLLNQRLGNYGNLYLSGSSSSYYGGKRNNRQLQFGYSNSYKNISYSISYTKQRTTQYNHINIDNLRPEDVLNNLNRYGNSNSMLSLTLTIPLGSGSNAPSFNTSASRHSDDKSDIQYQAGLNGTLGKERSFSYGINASHNEDGIGTSWNGNIQQRSPYATFGAGYASSNNYRQINASVRGAVVAHRAGLTLGPYVGDTFALVEAKGAGGATIRGGQGAKLNKSGFALSPSLTPYRYNSISIDSKGINENSEITETERKIAPYAGATVRVKFQTIFGQALLINSRLNDGAPLPLGADVYDADGTHVGIIGQGGQLYVRTTATKNTFHVKWGATQDEQCDLSYNIEGLSTSNSILRLNAICNSKSIRH